MKINLKIFGIKVIYILIDCACIFFVIYTSCLLRQKMIDYPLNLRSLLTDSENPLRFIFLIWTLTTVLVMHNNALYQTHREQGESLEIWRVIKGVFLSSFLTAMAVYVLKLYALPRTVFANIMMGMMIMLSMWRVLKRGFVEYLVAQGYNNFNTLIIGAGKVGTVLAQEINKRPGLGIKIVGFLDDLKDAPADGDGFKILGKISDFPNIARREFINKVFITIHHDSSVFSKLLEQAEELGIAVRVVPQAFDLTTGEIAKYNIGLIPILEYAQTQSLRKQVGKRLFDVLIGILGLVICLPVFLVIAFIIKMDSEGPVFYASKRYGRQGKIFKMYKFRSMVENAEGLIEQLKHKNEVDGPIFKMRKDPRVTQVGSFLRKYSLDELPQIMNVIKGDMSLVGPRPLPIEQVEKEDFRQLKRLEVRPGITGLWQIRGRSDISFARLLKWDIWYINNWSLWLDITILFQTIPVALKGKGAY